MSPHVPTIVTKRVCRLLICANLRGEEIHFTVAVCISVIRKEADYLLTCEVSGRGFSISFYSVFYHPELVRWTSSSF